jgi:HK97 family phage prohead protease/HK97 family phage major capsid protein
MPLPKPHKGESQDAFMGRCMHEAYGDNAPEGRTQDQAVAMCFQAWRDKDKADDGDKKPYGDVAYADPGYQSDGKPRYPIDTEEHIRAAWSYINKPENQKPYTAAQVSRIKGRIVAAWKAKIDPKGPPGAEEGKELSLFSPDDDEDYESFMLRCSEHLDDDACQMLWDELDEERQAKDIKHKTHSGVVSGMEFVLSDETPDRMDDIIMSNGWELASFKKNPIALFNHRSDFPVGKWKNLRVENKQLRGHLELAPEGTSERIDEIRKLVDAGILKAVSVGFRPVETTQREKGLGSIYIKSELVETSLVSVPANPNALAIAKGLKISPETMDMIFAGQGKPDHVQRREFNGGQAKSTRVMGKSQMSTLGQRIADLQMQITAKRDSLEDHLEKMDDSNVSNSDLEITSKLNQDIAQLERTYDALVESEKRLGKETGTPIPVSRSMTPAAPKTETSPATPAVILNRKKDSFDPLDLFIKAGVLTWAAKTWGRSYEQARERIGEVHREYLMDEARFMSDLVLRAASAPALTTVPGWAQELARTTYTDLMPLLMPEAVMTRLAAKGMSLSFGANGRIVIPNRNRTPSLAGSFVGEGLAIPVRQGSFSSQTLTPKKLAVITTWTREMDIHSIPAIEGILREAIQVDTSVAIDTVLLDNNAATAIRPAGLLNGVSNTTATTGGGIAAFIGDITALVGALTTNTYGNVRSPVFLVNPTDMYRASLLQATNTGIFPFRDEIRGGSINNIPIIDSANVTAKTMIIVDAADFVVAGSEAPRMEMSDQATLHMEDTNPTDLVASPSTVAAPQRSLFQTDSLALRMVLPLNWLVRRAGVVAYTSSVTW